MEDNPRGKIMLIDGNSLAYRAFYALPELKTSKGFPTNSVYGFLTMFFKVTKEYNPDYLVVAFDKDKRTLRHDLYQDYKGTRQATPPELRQQLPVLREVLSALRVRIVEMEGYEADDIIGTLARRAEDLNLECLIVTGDQDALQLVSESTRVILNRRGISETEVYDPKAVLEKWEVMPQQLIEVKALMGDASDNIPGVPSVGRKTAVKLIKEYGCLDNIYQHLDEIGGPKLRAALAENREQAYLSRRLATIVRDLDLDLDLEGCVWGEPDYELLIELYRELEFETFLKEINGISKKRVIIQEDPHILLDLNQMMVEIDRSQPLAVWVEADSSHPMRAEAVAVWLAQGEKVCRAVVDEDNLGVLKSLLEDESIKKYTHDLKFLYVIGLRRGIRLQGFTEDTLLLSYCLNPSFTGEDLFTHVRHYLGVLADAREPASAVRQIVALAECLHAKGYPEMEKIYREVELPLAVILGEMEYAGIRIDVSLLKELSKQLEGNLRSITEGIYGYAGGSFNLNSPKQLGTVLFETLKLPARKKTKTGYSTSAEVLEELYDEHPIIPLILDYRNLSKLKNTYVDVLPQNMLPETGRVHTVFKQAVTATGRLSSVEPNLQNIPIRSEQGARIRQAFVAEPGKVLLSADYSQIDLRVLAHMSGDENLIKAFVEGVDIHTVTASSIFKVPEEQVDSVLRRRAKAVNFGIVYGISDFGLARDTGVSRKEAREYIEKYLDTYPGVRRYMKEVVETARVNGYVTTILGRRRYLPDLLSSNYQVRSMAERMALNTPIQGSSADIIKLAMIQIDKRLKEEGIPARMLLQVHDELVFEVDERRVYELGRAVKRCMESALILKVPLTVTVEVGPNWLDMKELNVVA